MQTMKFTWEAFLLAPLPVPLIYAIAFVLATDGRSPFIGILVLFAIGSAVSYGATAMLLLPSLYLLSRFTVLTARLTSILGAVLGAASALAYVRLAFQASGENSGPPAGTFVEYFWRQLAEPIIPAMLIAGGLGTAAMYWRLAAAPPWRVHKPLSRLD
jgi:hypothetical protein